MRYETAHTWAEELEANPHDAVHRLLTVRDRIGPVARAEGHRALIWLSQVLAGNKDAPDEFDAALAEWCDARLRDTLADVDKVGDQVYAKALLDVVNALPAARLPRTRRLVVDRIAEFDHWFGVLTGKVGPSIHTRVYEVLAEIQPDRRFLSTWYRFCDQVGRGDRAHTYLRIALLGLRKMPVFEADAADGLRPEAITGLARFGRHLADTPENHRAFLGAWCTVTARHRDAEETHAEQIQNLLRRHNDKPFAQWWAEILGWSVPGQGATPLIEAPTRKDANDLVRQIEVARDDAIENIVRPFATRHEQYANATGDSYYLLRTFNRIGNKILDRAPELARELAETALTHDSSDEHSWVLWSDALAQLGRETDAEAVLWEARRRLIDGAYVRVKLGDLLASRGRLGEAEWVYRDTMRRFPDDLTPRNALADMLAKSSQPEEAESLLRETQKYPSDATKKRCHDKLIARTLLARLLIDTGRTDEGEGWYRETIGKSPDDRPSRLDLGLFLLSQGRADEAETILEDFREAQPKATEIETLAYWLKRSRAGERYEWRPLSAKRPQGDGALPSDWAKRAPVEAQVSRALFLAEAPAGDATSLLSEDGAKQLRDEAQATLARLQQTRPHNPVVRLIALRRQNGGTQQIADQTAPSEFAPAALRLAWARHTADVATIDRLIHDNGPLAPVAAIARLECDDANSEAAARTLVNFYHATLGGDASAIRRQVQNSLHRLIRSDHYAIGDAQNFLDFWAEELGPEDRRAFGDLVDLALLSCVEEDLPFALPGGTHEKWGEPMSV